MPVLAARIVNRRPAQVTLATFLALVTLFFDGKSEAAPPAQKAIESGRTFLAQLLDPEMDLLPEYREAKVYWLFHDNYLAAKVLEASHPQVARRIRAAIRREGITKSGKIEIVFGESEKPMPFRQYELIDVRKTKDKTIRTEVVRDRILEGWQDYADLLLLACLAEETETAARRHWNAAIKMWDGNGFLDAAARHNQRYATYKLALALLAAKRLSPPAELPSGLIKRLLDLQDPSGGWITDYDASGKPIGLANVETTCLSILGLRASDGPAK